jgi:predicted RNase H-like nuclease (RuvC/YqgF family)
MSKKQILFRLPEAKAQAFQEKAKAQGKSLNQILETFVDSYLSDDISSDGQEKENDNSTDSTNHSSDIKSDINVEELIDEKIKPLQDTIQEQQQEIRELRADYRELKLEQREAKLDRLESASEKKPNNDITNDKSDIKTDNTGQISGRKLAQRLGTSETSIRRQANKGKEHFKSWSSSKDPEGLSWVRDSQTKKYQVVEVDQNGYKVNHKLSDDEHQISNGDKSPNGHQENAPSVEQLEKYPTRTP